MITTEGIVLLVIIGLCLILGGISWYYIRKKGL